jgi:predicted DCC family thiol-disulfide oxidoreductase YuxK
MYTPFTNESRKRLKKGDHVKKTEQLTVYYNSACPVCDAGIGMQKAQKTSCGITWIDVHKTPDAAKELGIDIEHIRERLHVRDETGKLIVGASAMAALWQQTPSQQWLAKIVNFPAMRWMAEKSYNLFAKTLYRWNRILKHW